MSVTFNRTNLISVAQRALHEHEKAKRTYDLACEEYRRQHAARATELTRARAFNLRAAITKALKRNGPVFAQELQDAIGGRYIGDQFYCPPNDFAVEKGVIAPKGLLKPVEVIEAKTLIKVLQAATGDEVSANELKLLGLKNLQPVFAAAAVAAA